MPYSISSSRAVLRVRGRNFEEFTYKRGRCVGTESKAHRNLAQRSWAWREPLPQDMTRHDPSCRDPGPPRTTGPRRCDAERQFRARRCPPGDRRAPEVHHANVPEVDLRANRARRCSFPATPDSLGLSMDEIRWRLKVAAREEPPATCGTTVTVEECEEDVMGMITNGMNELCS